MTRWLLVVVVATVLLMIPYVLVQPARAEPDARARLAAVMADDSG